MTEADALFSQLERKQAIIWSLQMKTFSSANIDGLLLLLDFMWFLKNPGKNFNEANRRLLDRVSIKREFEKSSKWFKKLFFMQKLIIVLKKRTQFCFKLLASLEFPVVLCTGIVGTFDLSLVLNWVLLEFEGHFMKLTPIRVSFHGHLLSKNDLWFK